MHMGQSPTRGATCVSRSYAGSAIGVSCSYAGPQWKRAPTASSFALNPTNPLGREWSSALPLPTYFSSLGSGSGSGGGVPRGVEASHRSASI
eukprot:978172-Pyramimonas_sp.AAC.1